MRAIFNVKLLMISVCGLFLWFALPSAFASKLCGCTYPKNIFPDTTPNCYQPCVGFGSLSCSKWGADTGLQCTQLASSCPSSGGHSSCKIENYQLQRCYLRYQSCKSSFPKGYDCYEWAGSNCRTICNEKGANGCKAMFPDDSTASTLLLQYIK